MLHVIVSDSWEKLQNAHIGVKLLVDDERPACRLHDELPVVLDLYAHIGQSRVVARRESVEVLGVVFCRSIASK